MNKTALRALITLVLLAALAGGFVYSMRSKQHVEQITAKQAAMVTLKGLISLDVEPMLKDPRVVQILADHQFTLQVTRVGSREMADKVAEGHDFYLPSGVVAANQIGDAAKAAKRVTSSYSPFYTPMVIASWVPIAKVLAHNGAAKAVNDHIYELDFPKLADLMLSKKRWSDLTNNPDYKVSRSILVSTTDVRKSNSAAMYLALASYALNKQETVTDRESAQRIARQVAELFKRQGYQENYVNGNFDDYVSIGMGKTPMAFIYENQLVSYAMTKRGITSDMVLMYPKPTIFNKVMLIASNDHAKRLGELLSSDPALRKIATEYGFRGADVEAFSQAAAQAGLVVQSRINDVIDPPAYDIMAQMIEVISEEMKQ